MVVLILKCIRIAGVVGFPKGWFFRTFPRDEISCMCSDRKLGFNWGRILDHVVLVDFEVDLLALVKIKPLFDNPAHGNDRLFVNGFCQPEWNFVTFSSDIYYGTIHNVSEFTKCFTWKVMGEILHYWIIVPTGWPKSKFPISNGYSSVSEHFWPHVGKVKMCLKGGSFFMRFSWFFIIVS